MTYNLYWFKGAVALQRAHYGPGTGFIFLDNLQCSGNENNLFECSHNGVGEHNCNHHEDASAVCQGAVNN